MSFFVDTPETACYLLIMMTDTKNTMEDSMTNQINHTDYQARIATLTADQLRWTIKDCQEALAAMPDSPKAGYYADEINYCAAELHRRQQVARDAQTLQGFDLTATAPTGAQETHQIREGQFEGLPVQDGGPNATAAMMDAVITTRLDYERRGWTVSTSQVWR